LWGIDEKAGTEFMVHDDGVEKGLDLTYPNAMWENKTCQV
jgi:hypothetical protein